MVKREAGRTTLDSGIGIGLGSVRGLCFVEEGKEIRELLMGGITIQPLKLFSGFFRYGFRLLKNI